jgi:hypothetical protein
MKVIIWFKCYLLLHKCISETPISSDNEDNTNSFFVSVNFFGYIENSLRPFRIIPKDSRSIFNLWLTGADKKQLHLLTQLKDFTGFDSSTWQRYTGIIYKADGSAFTASLRMRLDSIRVPAA